MDPTLTQPVKVSLYDMAKGDSWPGIPLIGPITFITEEDPTPTNPLFRLELAELVFCKEGSDIPVLVISSRNGCPTPITIENATTWRLSVPAIPRGRWPLDVGTYTGRLQLVDSAGNAITTHELTQNII